MTLQINDLSKALSHRVTPTGVVHVPYQSGWYRNHGKRVLDLVFVCLGSIVAVPVILFLAAVVSLDGHAPFYRSDRVGRNGRTFHMLKLRTMVPGADRMLKDYLARDAAARDEWGRRQKLTTDPRITWIGQFLRVTSLDELPQIWNVLAGDMSLVGPRPIMPDQRVLYTGLSYYALRPGITGLWQVSERNAADFARRADLDRQYERKMGLIGDLRILMVTARAVLRGTGS